jgi:tetratricopeptide (TPR) repeat protein
MSDEEKKQRAEIEAKNAEITAKNEKIKNADELARKANAEAQAAYNAGNYDLAIEKYSEGIEAVPDFIGSTPILWSGKMMSLKAKGRGLYNEAVKLTDADQKKAKYAEANRYFDETLAGFDAAMKIINAAEPAKDPADQKRRDAMKLGLYSVAIDAHRLKAVTLIDSSKADQAGALITEYEALETDPAKKVAALTTLGDIMRLSFNYDKAAAAYRSALEMKPDHYDAMAGLGLSLFAQGAAATPEDKDLEQEGLNYMQKYTEVAPVSPSDPPAVAELKKSVKEAVDYLKSQKMAPQKVAAPGKKKS